MLILLTGLPGTGKSTLGKNISKKIKGVILQTDAIRKKIVREPKYTDEEKEIVYNTLFLIARYLLMARINVILDGTFYKKELRERVYNLAQDTRHKMVIIEAVTPNNIIKIRMKRREKRGRGLSDADYEVYKQLKEDYEPISRRHITVDTSNTLSHNLRQIYEHLKI